jgi:hypothetical protein
MLENSNIYWKGSVQNEMGERLTERFCDRRGVCPQKLCVFSTLYPAKAFANPTAKPPERYVKWGLKLIENYVKRLCRWLTK